MNLTIGGNSSEAVAEATAIGESMKFIDKDILTVSKGIICHQVNTKGVMGAGLALAIRTKWPKAYDYYKNNRLFLGGTLFTKVDNRLWVAHLIAQESFGPGVQTDYVAFREAIRQVRLPRDDRLSDLHGLNIYLPYKIGCGLAGGDWNTVLAIIEEELPDAIICVRPTIQDRRHYGCHDDW